jgi:pimeloyl-ACP methyl ester carboxylesterase
MGGTKATALAEHCRYRDQPFLRFDSSAMAPPAISAGSTAAGRGAPAVIDELTEGPQILVGSSMGGWIALLAALARPGRIRGLIGIASAPDFTEDLIWNRLSTEQARRFKASGELSAPSAYEPELIPITYRLVEEGRRHLLLRRPIALACPVRLLHGMQDPDVPYQTSLRLAENLPGTEAVVELIEDGDHRLSRPEDLARLFTAVDGMTARVRTP